MRRLGVVVALALPAAMLLPVGTATAAVSSPGRGTVFTSDTTIAIRAEHGPSGDENRLTLTSPGGPAVVVAQSPGNRLAGGTLSYSLDTGCWTFPACAGSRPAPNGEWVVEQSGGATDRLAFVVRIPPRPPQDVTASALSTREVQVSWTRGAEPDLTGFAVFEGDRAVVNDLDMGACTETGCSAVVRYPSDRPGEHRYVVRSFRSTSPGSSEQLASAPSGVASATVPAPDSSPSPDPTSTPAPGAPGPGGPGPDAPGPGSGPDASPDAGGGSPASSPGASPGPDGEVAAPPSADGSTSASPGAPTDTPAAQQRRAFAQSFNSFAPKLGIPKLPPLPIGPAPAVAGPLADGTFDPTLGFQDQVTQELVETGRAAGPLGAVADALDSERLARSTAGALLLLLTAAHLRRWVTSGPAD